MAIPSTLLGFERDKNQANLETCFLTPALQRLA